MEKCKSCNQEILKTKLCYLTNRPIEERQIYAVISYPGRSTPNKYISNSYHFKKALREVRNAYLEFRKEK